MVGDPDPGGFCHAITPLLPYEFALVIQEACALHSKNAETTAMRTLTQTWWLLLSLSALSRGLVPICAWETSEEGSTSLLAENPSITRAPGIL